MRGFFGEIIMADRILDEYQPLEFYKKSLKLIVDTAHVLDENLESLAKPVEN